MNAPRTLKNAPNPVQFLFSPSQSARTINSSGKGLSWVIGIWALDFVFQNPFTVSRWLMRASESPLSGLSTLWSFFVNASLLSACLAGALGILLYYSKRKSQQPWDLWNSMIVAGYCFVPHTVLVALSAALGYGGFDSPWLLHHQNLSSPASDIQTVVRASPVLFYAWLCWRSEESPRLMALPGWLRLTPILLIITGLSFTTNHILNNQQKARPLMQGDSLPAFAIFGEDGKIRRLNQSRGKVLLIDVWATWCGPCVAAMPHLESLHREFNDQGFELISLNVEPGRRAEVLAFMREKKLSFPVYFDRGEARKNLMVNLYPTLVLVREDGTIESIYNGTLGLAALRGDIERLLGL